MANKISANRLLIANIVVAKKAKLIPCSISSAEIILRCFDCSRNSMERILHAVQYTCNLFGNEFNLAIERLLKILMEVI